MSTRKGLVFRNMKRIRIESAVCAVCVIVILVMFLAFLFGHGEPGAVPDSVFAQIEEDCLPIRTDIVDLNSASSCELQMLPGVGTVIAERIVAYRNENGPFSSVEDIMQVSGIGAETFSGFADFVTVR